MQIARQYLHTFDKNITREINSIHVNRETSALTFRMEDTSNIYFKVPTLIFTEFFYSLEQFYVTKGLARSFCINVCVIIFILMATFTSKRFHLHTLPLNRFVHNNIQKSGINVFPCLTPLSTGTVLLHRTGLQKYPSLDDKAFISKRNKIKQRRMK